MVVDLDSEDENIKRDLDSFVDFKGSEESQEDLEDILLEDDMIDWSLSQLVSTSLDQHASITSNMDFEIIGKI